MAQKRWDMEMILETARSFHESAVLIAAAELDVFSVIVSKSIEATEMAARRTGCYDSGVRVLVDVLVATEGGGTFTFEEDRGDLESAGFAQVELLHRDEHMDSLIVGRK